MKMVYRHDIKWKQIYRPTHTSRMLGRLVSANNTKFWYLHGCCFHVAHVSCLSGAGWSRLPWDVLPVVSDVAIPDGSESADSLSTDETGAEVLVCSTPAMGASSMACYKLGGWWITNSSYAESGCTPPHPWGIPNRLVHWVGSPFKHIFPIFLSILYFMVAFVGRLGPCPLPPRLLSCLTCHSLVYGILPLLHGMIWPSCGPIWLIPSVSVQTLR